MRKSFEVTPPQAARYEGFFSLLPAEIAFCHFPFGGIYDPHNGTTDGRTII